MPIRLECPRCNQSLAVPKKKAGSYVHCPKCKGRFWVPEDAPVDLTLSDPAGGPTAIDMLARTPGAAAAMSGASSFLWPAAAAPPAAPPAAPAAVSPAAPPGDSPGAATVIPPGAAPSVPPGGAPLRGAVDLPPSPAAPAVLRPGGPGPALQIPAAPPPPAPATRPAAAVPPAGPKKVARFIPADASQSTLKLAEDGKLPELHLQEGQQSAKPERKLTAVNPLVLLGALCLSVALSVVLVLVNVDSRPAGGSRQHQSARRVIEDEYFANDDASKPLEPYQICLREARQAHSRGDRKAEREAYRKVLDLLRAERGPFDKGVTGSRSRDKKLELQISILLSED